jgi:Uma2 family endonuclease
MLAPADLDLRSGQLVQPDLFVVPLQPDGREPKAWSDCGIPLLIAEVRSPSTAYHDRTTKRLRFQQSGVAEYWIVDADARAFERWNPSDSRPEVLDDRITWHPEGVSDALVIDLAEYFREVWGES